MSKPYSIDLRELAMARLEAGETTREVAAALRVAVSSVIKWAARKRLSGSIAPGKMGGHRPRLISREHRLFVLGEVDRDANMTPHRLSAALAERGLSVHPASVGRFLHREGKSFKKVVRAAGAKLFFLPPCSPDLNPTEQLFAKLKHWMRRAAQRSVETVHNTIATALDAITPKECRNYLENAGYKST